MIGNDGEKVWEVAVDVEGIEKEKKGEGCFSGLKEGDEGDRPLLTEGQT